MDAREANTITQIKTKHTSDLERPFANFPPSIWGDHFLSFSLDISKLEAYAKATDEPKEDLRKLINSPTMNTTAKLSLINSVYRLGLKHMFVEDIDCQLDKLFKEFHLEDYDEADLYTISVTFQVFRQYGYKLPCDVFNKFRDCATGKFKEYITADIRGMLSFYESTQLRIRGESILDEAFTFTEGKLKGVVETLEGNLAQQVKYALGSSFHRGIQMLEARLYFSNYKEECSKYNSLLYLANAHFNYLHLLQKSELQILTKWTKDNEFKVIAPFVRDRLPELYLWILAIYMEPHYSQARIITAKIGHLVSLIDDTYDAYASMDEIRLLTDAIDRWDICAIENLPEYMKPIYKVLLHTYTELEKQLSKEGKAFMVNASKKSFQELARAYHEEAEWKHSGYMPSFEEYLKNGIISSAYNVFAKASIVGMGATATEETLSWYEGHPKILEASELLARVHNDVMSFQFEGERALRVTAVDTYMKSFGVPEAIAIDELKKIIENAWKDINEGCLKPTEVSLEQLSPIVNLARMIDVVYRCNDGYTFPEKTIKNYITLLFVDSVPCTN